MKWLVRLLLTIGLFLSCKDKKASLYPKVSSDERMMNYKINSDSDIYRGIKKAKEERDTLKLAKIYNKAGLYYIKEKKQVDSAFYYFNLSRYEYVNLKDSVSIAKELINMAGVQNLAGDYYGAEETSIEALSYLKNPKYSSSLAMVYDKLGMARVWQTDYEKALECFSLGLKYAIDDAQRMDRLIIKNNMSVALINSEKYAEAIPVLEEVLRDDSISTNTSLKMRAMSNLAYSRWKVNPKYNPLSIYEKGLEYRKKKEKGSLVSSYIYISEYYHGKDINKAIEYLEKAYAIAQKENKLDSQLVILENLIKWLPYSKSKVYLEDYIRKNDSLQIQRVKAKNQFALIHYEVSKNKEENLRLKTENAQKSYRILQQRIIVFVVCGLSLTAFILSYFWYKKRKEHFTKEKIEEVNKIELKYSKKIHDEVANGIYQLMMQFDEIDVEGEEAKRFVDDLERLYHKSRNISHESEFRADLENNYVNVLVDSLQPYAAEKTRVIVLGNNVPTWVDVSVDVKEEIYHILIELMTNMKKHSRATFVTVKFDRIGNDITINYYDNGVGIDKDKLKLGKGLRNIEDRVNTIHGKLEIDKNRLKGFSIRILVTV